MAGIFDADFLRGFHLGKAFRSNLLRAVAGKGEPVAYLYNGVRLPPLPEWDKEKYPYAWIRGIEDSDGNTRYLLRVGSEAITFKNTMIYVEWKKYDVYSQTGEGHTYEGLYPEDREWVISQEDVWFDNYFKVEGFIFSWVNHDVINEDDGTVYQYATDPIPVYE